MMHTFFVFLNIGLLTGVISFVLHRFIRSQSVDDADELDPMASLQRDLDAMQGIDTAKPASRRRKYPAHYLHGQWREFGGGYYGLIALLTFFWIEAQDVWQWIAEHGSLRELIQALDVRMFVNMIIEAIFNTLWALVWPVYWLAELSTFQFICWLAATLIGYCCGKQLARINLSSS